MSAPEQAGKAGPAAPQDMAQLEAEIEQTRGQLGETVAQLAAKTDVKARAREKTAEFSRRLKSTASQYCIPLAAGAFALAVSFLVVRRWRRR